MPADTKALRVLIDKLRKQEWFVRFQTEDIVRFVGDIAPKEAADALASLLDAEPVAYLTKTSLAELHRPGEHIGAQTVIYNEPKDTRIAVYRVPVPAEAPDGWRLVPEAALKWLFGEGPDNDGNWFADSVYTKAKVSAYWWRPVFRRMLLAAPGKGNTPEDAQ